MDMCHKLKGATTGHFYSSQPAIKTFNGRDLEDSECEHPFKGYGYEFKVKVLEVDKQGRVRLSIKAVEEAA